MIILDKPYVSDFLKDTVFENAISVLDTPILKHFDLPHGINLIDSTEAICSFENGEDKLIFANNENALSWIINNLKFTDFPRQIKLFKNKFKLRKLLKKSFPEFGFQEVALKDLNTIDIKDLQTPFVIKPSVGFFSIGVHTVWDKNQWPKIIKTIEAEVENAFDIYPQEVLSSTSFIIEDYLEGDEYAIDAFWDEAGKPVIVNILKHVFSSENDVSDRMYLTSKKIIQENLNRFDDFLNIVGKAAQLKNFPAHVEVRIDAAGKVIPIEINPMRFAGWCTTDISQHAFGINSYLHYFRQQAPDWDSILQSKGDEIYAVSILAIPEGLKHEEIDSFDYDLLLAKFEKPLELRKINYSEYPVFAFVFSKTRDDNFEELETILKSDLKEFIRLK